uniref:Aldo_ket_red domain-containing protein n=1 Tax=Steinernema glaseri TaxID=37863 RepID=A0A1I8AEK9_9BILA
MARFGNTRGGYVRMADGYEMPLFGLGTYKTTSQKDMDRAVDAALKNGYRLFDTAFAYGNEEQLGKALQKLLPEHNLTQADVFVTTKVPILSGDNKKERTYEVVCESLKKLQLDAIDLVLVHYPREWSGSDKSPKNQTDRIEVYQALERCKEEGKVRSIGVSNFEIRHLQELLQVCRYRPVVNQCEFHPFCCRRELLEYCRQQEIFFEAFTSLARQDPKLYKNEVVLRIAESHNMDVSHVLLAFALTQHIGVIPKSSNPERIAENINVVGKKLTLKEVEDLLSLNRTYNYTDCSPWDVV